MEIIYHHAKSNIFIYTYLNMEKTSKIICLLLMYGVQEFQKENFYMQTILQMRAYILC